MTILTILVALVALTAAQAPAKKPTKIHRSTAPLGPFKNVLPEAVCDPGCKTVCAAQKMFCVNLPGLITCEDINKQCVDLCDTACDCFAECREECDKQTNCNPADLFSINGALCQLKLKGCVATCQSTCPVQFQFAVLQATLQTSMKQLQNFFSVFTPKKQ